MYKAQEVKARSIGDAAVEGLLNGIFAGVVMLAVVVAFEFAVGVSPMVTLGYFDAGPDFNGTAGSPLIGALTHLAVSGIYGLVFGMVGMVVLGARLNLGLWLLLGVLYGLLLFGVAQWVILPRANTPLDLVPAWLFAAVHVLYGVVLAWLLKPGKN